MTVLPYRDRDHTFIRFLSTRTGETLFEIKMLDGAMHGRRRTRCPSRVAQMMV